MCEVVGRECEVGCVVGWGLVKVKEGMSEGRGEEVWVGDDE